MSELLVIKSVIPDEPDINTKLWGQCCQCGRGLFQGYTWFEFGRFMVCPDCLERYINDRKVTA